MSCYPQPAKPRNQESFAGAGAKKSKAMVHHGDLTSSQKMNVYPSTTTSICAHTISP
jgi:hypothetical protein